MKQNKWMIVALNRWQKSKLILLLMGLTLSVIVCTQAAMDLDIEKVGQMQHNQIPSSDSRMNIMSYEVAPKVTDTQINDWLDNHYVVVPSQPVLNQLVVFLSGSFGKPSRQHLFAQIAAQQGFHAINLMYPNRWTVGGLCRGSQAADCFGKVRQEIIQGQNLSPIVNVDTPNSIHNRLLRTLQYLDKQYPEQGWNQYLQQNDVNWSAVTVAGHSQGGGHAAMLGKLYSVNRVIMLASPADFDPRSRTMASWLAEPGLTAADRYFGFVHAEDPGFRKILAAWHVLGLGKMGDVVDIDNRSSPYHNSHQLVTHQRPGKAGGHHGSVAVDAATPMDQNGRPIFQSIWQYLLSS